MSETTTEERSATLLDMKPAARAVRSAYGLPTWRTADELAQRAKRRAELRRALGRRV